jgi:hypothetical protein
MDDVIGEENQRARTPLHRLAEKNDVDPRVAMPEVTWSYIRPCRPMIENRLTLPRRRLMRGPQTGAEKGALQSRIASLQGPISTRLEAGAIARERRPSGRYCSNEWVRLPRSQQEKDPGQLGDALQRTRAIGAAHDIADAFDEGGPRAQGLHGSRSGLFFGPVWAELGETRLRHDPGW